MTDEPNPTLARRRLAVRLRAARERNGRTLPDLAAALKVSLPQASRLDSGARGFKPEQIEMLAEWYTLGSAERAQLADLVVESKRRAWWQQVDLADSYRTLIGLEKGARTISEYCSTAVPGLLQTAAYALASASAGAVDRTAGAIDQVVDVRMRRQAELMGSNAPTLRVVIDESVLARLTGGPRVMAGQLEHLLVATERPRTIVQVVGFESGTHVGVNVPQFILLDMGPGVLDVVYTESGRLDPADTDDVDQVVTYQRYWDLIRAQALNEVDSRNRIGKYLQALSG